MARANEPAVHPTGPSAVGASDHLLLNDNPTQSQPKGEC